MGGGGVTPRFWTPTTPPTNCRPKAPLGGGGGGGGLGGGGSGRGGFWEGRPGGRFESGPQVGKVAT